jgi:hypothetical protein
MPATRDDQPLTHDAAKEWLLEARRIGTPCERCDGIGGLLYPSTATWKGGVGGRAMTWDVCDRCWGSGDSDRPWTDLCTLQVEEDRRVAEQAWSYFAEGLGTDLPSIAASLIELAKEISKIRRPSPSKRKRRPQFFENVCAHLERRVVEGVAAWERGRKSGFLPPPPPSPDKAKQLWEVCMAWRDKVEREGAPIEIHILTDMPWSKARELLALNSVRVPESRIHSCDYATHGDGYKAEVARTIGLDALVDDHMGYLSVAGAPMLRMLVMPDPSQPYYDPAWKTSVLDPPEWGRQTYKAP